MLKTILVSPDATVASQLSQTLSQLAEPVELCRVVDHYPSTADLWRVLRAHAPEVLFLSFENISLALATVRFLESQGAGVQIIAVHGACEATHLRESMRAGIREFLTSPFDAETVADSLRNVAALLQKRPAAYDSTNNIFAFLPSKAGVGATTLAVNVSAAIAKNKSLLLTDLDLNSGMLRFLLKLTTEYSVVDAVENSGQMDENIWPQLVTERLGMSILHAGRVNPNLRIEPAQVDNLIQFMRRNYEALAFDLSGNLERYSIEVMQESRRIFLVCTPEIPSLHLAREKMGFLKTLGLDAKISVLLNRVPKRSPFTNQQVEELVGAKVAAAFSNDYFAVGRATTAGEALDPQSLIGRQCAAFAAEILERPNAPVKEKRKKFLEMFNVGQQLVAQD